MTKAGSVAEASGFATTWPFSQGSMLIDRELARNITAWALTCMSPAELHSYSQRRLMWMYIDHLKRLLLELTPSMEIEDPPRGYPKDQCSDATFESNTDNADHR
jgi:hypothetical protein